MPKVRTREELLAIAEQCWRIAGMPAAEIAERLRAAGKPDVTPSRRRETLAPADTRAPRGLTAAEYVQLRAAHGARTRQNGPDRWMVTCPLGAHHRHGDRTPSLSVRQGDKGVALHCFAGCDTAAVLEADGLHWPDVFDERFECRPPARVERLIGHALDETAQRRGRPRVPDEYRPVLTAIKAHMFNAPSSFPGEKLIAARVGCNRRRVWEAKRWLGGNGYLTWTRRRPWDREWAHCVYEIPREDWSPPHRRPLLRWLDRYHQGCLSTKRTATGKEEIASTTVRTTNACSDPVKRRCKPNRPPPTARRRATEDETTAAVLDRVRRAFGIEPIRWDLRSAARQATLKR